MRLVLRDVTSGQTWFSSAITGFDVRPGFEGSESLATAETCQETYGKNTYFAYYNLKVDYEIKASGGGAFLQNS